MASRAQRSPARLAPRNAKGRKPNANAMELRNLHLNSVKIMRIPSRYMPERDAETTGPIATAFLIFLLCLPWALPAIYCGPIFLALTCLYLAFALSNYARQKEIRRQRRGEDIGTFARSFNYREIDTWIIRAVFEEFSDNFPVRKTDRLEDDLQIDHEDFEDSVTSIAERTGINLDNTEANPYYGKIHSIEDLVMFLKFQPRPCS